MRRTHREGRRLPVLGACGARKKGEQGHEGNMNGVQAYRKILANMGEGHGRKSRLGNRRPEMHTQLGKVVDRGAKNGGSKKACRP